MTEPTAEAHSTVSCTDGADRTQAGYPVADNVVAYRAYHRRFARRVD
jgi:hypothetical protein